MNAERCIHLSVCPEAAECWRSLAVPQEWMVRRYADCDTLIATYKPARCNCAVFDVPQTPLDKIARFIALPDAPPVLVRVTGKIIMFDNLIAFSFDGMAECFRAGVWDALLLPVSNEQLIAKTNTAFEADRERQQQRGQWQTSVNRLSPRERQVFTLLLEAANTIQISNNLGIRPKTAEKHRLHVLEKFGVQSVPELLKRVAR